MPVKMRNKPVKTEPLPEIKESELKVFDIPLELLIENEQNPNEMSEDDFDELVEGMRNDEFDDPIEVVPHPHREGYYLIAGGHHRKRAAKVVGMTHVPSIIKTGWGEDQAKIALVRRNILHGKMNTTKFTELYQDLAKKYDQKLLQTMLGFTNKKAFESLYDGVEKSLPPKQRKELAKAKETIKSVDDLSSVLNRIFKESGSQADSGYLVFSFGGKEHHYVKIDDATNRKLKQLKKQTEGAGLKFNEFLQSIISDAGISGSVKPVRKIRRTK